MFEFAISQHQRRPLSRRFRTAVAVSILAHIAVLIVLILSPAGPFPGLGSWLRPLAFLALAYFLVLLALARGGRAASEKELFEFAISQHQRHPPSRRFLRAVAVSILAHIAAVVLLIQFPSLLLPGLSSWLRPLAFLRVTVKETDWRMVSMLGNIQAADAFGETLRKLLPKRSEEGTGSQKTSVPIRWGDEKLVPRARAPGPAAAAASLCREPRSPNLCRCHSRARRQARGDPDQERRSESDLCRCRGCRHSRYAGEKTDRSPAASVPRTKADTQESRRRSLRANLRVRRLRLRRWRPSPVPGKQDPRVFENVQKAIRSEGTGFFDTKGFPLGEYATLDHRAHQRKLVHSVESSE